MIVAKSASDGQAYAEGRVEMAPAAPRFLSPDDKRLRLKRRTKNRGAFAERVQEERERLGLSISRLSEVSGVNKATISLIEQGIAKDVGVSTLVKLADMFEVSLDYLVGRTDVRTFPPP